MCKNLILLLTANVCLPSNGIFPLKLIYMSTSNKPVVVVVGNGMVGHKFCEKLMAASPSFQIVVFGEEPRPAYDRVHLSEYFNGKSAGDLSLSMAGWFDEQDI